MLFKGNGAGCGGVSSSIWDTGAVRSPELEASLIYIVNWG